VQVAPARSYRCTYTPLDRDGFPVPCDTGVLPFVQVKAGDAEEAQRAAHALTGCPVTEVQRIEPEGHAELPTAIANFCAAFDDTVTGALA
jgi:hypothetical protein